MIEFALVAAVLVAVVVFAVWKLRPREVDGVDVTPAPGIIPIEPTLGPPQTLLEMAKRERSDDFRASLAGLVSPERWQDCRSSSLDELRRIVATWADPAPVERKASPGGPGDGTSGPYGAHGASDPSCDLASRVSQIIGFPLVEVRLRSRSEVSVLVRRGRSGSEQTAVVR